MSAPELSRRESLGAALFCFTIALGAFLVIATIAMGMAANDVPATIRSYGASPSAPSCVRCMRSRQRRQAEPDEPGRGDGQRREDAR